MINENRVLKIKPKDIYDMWKNFWNPTPDEKTDEEKILADNKISETNRKELLKAIENSEKLINQLYKNSYKTTKLEIKDSKASAKEGIQKNTKSKSKQIENSEKER